MCPHRCDDLDMQHLRPMGDLGNIVTLENFSIRDDEFIKYSISKSNVVINLIGQNTETWNYGFKEVSTVLCHLHGVFSPVVAALLPVTHRIVCRIFVWYRYTRIGLVVWQRCVPMCSQLNA